MKRKTRKPVAGGATITRQELAKRWDISVMTIRRMEMRGTLDRVSGGYPEPGTRGVIPATYSMSQVLELERSGKKKWSFAQ